MKTFAVAASFAGLAVAQKPEYQKLWDQWKADNNKYFPGNSDEEQKRFQIFKDNVDIVDSHNAKKLSYTLGINEYADQTAEEFFKTHLGYNPGQKPFEGLPKVPFTNVTDVADSVDWVSKGAVTPVKNQQRCGSCWAFSTTGSTEGAYFVSSGKLLSLSEQDLVSCDHDGDQGCQGGLMDHAFGWIKKNGICAESDYPYKSGGGQTGTCQKKCKAAVTVTGFTDVPSKDEDALKQAVSKQPVSVAIEADKSAFQLYKSGVLDNAACGTQLDHGVLVVGYGTDGGKDYWKVKNSWGPAWGEEGYLRMIRNKNQCGIATQPSYPTGAKAAGLGFAGKHYEDPKDGCSSDEVDIKIQGVGGAVCSPACSTSNTCPTDVPSGVTAKPQCALQDSSSGKKYCALICSPSSNDAQCGTNASCKSISGVGICTYDDSTDLMHTSTKYQPTSDAVVV